jgi:hypothetical protein
MIESVLERIAVSLETIVSRMKTVEMGSNPEPPRTLSPEDIKNRLPGGSPADAVAKTENEREALKEELTKLGVKFSASAKTESLKKLLEAAKTAKIPPVDPAAPAGPETDPFADSAPAPATPIVGLDDVRKALVDLSAAKGKDMALAVLRDKGKVPKLSDVTADNYQAIVDECKKKMEVANG